MNKLKKHNRHRSTPGVNQGIALLMIVALAAGCGGEKAESEKGHEHPAAAEKKAEMWTCAMHPQIQLPKPGKCPICGMDLIPVKAGGGDEMEGPRTLTMSDAAKKLAEIQVSPVERKFVTVDIRMVGKVDYDETKLAYITAWVPGRLDRLFVDYTGVPVAKGDHMVYIYSPEIYSAEEELLQAIEASRELKKSNIAIMRETADATVEAVRERLRLWGLTPEQIQEIELRKKASDHITIYAPIGGIVIHKEALEGMYVQEGTKIYTIADLAHVWIMLDAYESDLAWIHYGQDVEFTPAAYPGEVFTGKIAFIDPVLNEKTRTVKVRVNAENPSFKLKPGMFVRAIVKSNVAMGGRVMDPALTGKWVCPMHPDVIEDHAGDCPICGMPLVRTESLGYVSVADKAAAPLVIPASAPLITGKRAVVYVQVPGKEKPTFEGREIVLGARAGDYYIVKSGLKEGELVVTNGAFKIDSAVQIEAKPSMMMPEGGGPGGGHLHDRGGTITKPGKQEKSQAPQLIPEQFKKQLSKVLGDYLVLQECLADDDQGAGAEAAREMKKALGKVDMKLLKGPAHMAWMKEEKNIKKGLEQLIGAKNIEGQRRGFALLSETMPTVLKEFKPTGEKVIYRFKCPMAFSGRGATWLQATPEIRNPYFGKTMLKCGNPVAL